jgi:hypothetical protein
MTAIEYLDRVPAGWFVLDVMRKETRKWDWVALVIDVNPDDLKNCACDFPALFMFTPKSIAPVNVKHGSNGLAFRESTGIRTPLLTLLRK